MFADLSSIENRFLDYFTPEGRLCLLDAVQEASCAEGEVLFEEGAPSDCVYLILSGELEVFKASGGGRSVPLARFSPGDYIGELGVLSEKPRTTGARASRSASFARIPVAAVKKALEKEPARTALSFLDRALGYIHETNDRYSAAVVEKGKMQLVGEMSGSIIHDLRNPIAMIDLAVHLLLKVHTDAGTQRACSTIHRQAERMTGMVQDLQDFSEGTVVLDLEETDIEELLRDHAQSIIDLVERGGVRLIVRGEPGRAPVDSRRLLRVLDALVSNSLTAMDGKGGTLELDAGRSEGHVEIRVRDDGPGIAPEVRETLFQPFVTHGKRRGTGLGLAVARKVVEAHGGTLTAVSPPAPGAEFLIRLPE